MEKREAQLAAKEAAAPDKQRQLLEVQEKRKLSAQRVAAGEDTVQRSGKESQLNSERPDLRTGKTYQKEIRQKNDLESAALIGDPDASIDQLAGNDDMFDDLPSVGLGAVLSSIDDEFDEFPPESTVDTDPDGQHAFSDVGSDEDDAYKPPSNEEDDDDDSQGEGGRGSEQAQRR